MFWALFSGVDSDNSEIVQDSSNSDEESNDDDSGPRQLRRKGPKIVVVLGGPFTTSQLELAKKRTCVRWNLVRKALKWLKSNNPLYAEFILDECECQPIVINETTEAPAVNNNIETRFEISAVFPDSDVPREHNGGCENGSEFAKATMDRLLSNAGNTEATVIARPTQTLLRDYHGDNLMKAFPLQFPYGVGWKDTNDEERGGLGYLKYLTSLSRTDFHTPAFCRIPRLGCPQRTQRGL